MAHYICEYIVEHDPASNVLHTFPLDMLRREGAWPADSEAVVALGHYLDPQSRADDPGWVPSVRLKRIGFTKSAAEPERKRWETFGWWVKYVHIIKR